MSYATFQNKSTLNNLPSNWAVRKFTDIVLDVSAGNDKVKKRDYRTKGKYPVIDQSQSLVAGYTSDHRPVKAKGPCIAFGDHTRAVKYVEFPFVMGADGVKVLICDENVLTKYIYYFLNSIEIPDTGYNRHFKFLKDLSIPLPPLEEQKRIADILDKAQRLIEAKRTVILKYEALIDGCYARHFLDKPYKMKSIGEICQVKTGSTPSRKNSDYYNGNIPWVKTTEVKGEEITDCEEYITESGLENSNCTIYPKNTILVAMYGQGSTRGRCGILRIEAASNQACAAILPSEHIESDFLFVQLQQKYNELRELGRGGNQPNLNLSMIREFEVIVPPKSEQQVFVRTYKHILKSLTDHKKSLEHLENLYHSLLQRAFKGELTKQKVG